MWSGGSEKGFLCKKRKEKKKKGDKINFNISIDSIKKNDEKKWNSTALIGSNWPKLSSYAL